MRMFKKIAAMIMAVAMLCSFTALGAGVTITGIADVTTKNPNVVVGYESTDVKDVTVLAYAGEKLEGANLVYINQLAGNSDVGFALGEKDPFGKYTVMMGGTGLATAVSATFDYKDGTPTYKVTLAECANGTVSYDAASLDKIREGSEVSFEFVPYLGYELTSLMVNGEEKIASVDNGNFAIEVAADTTIAPVFAEVVATEGKSYTYAETFEVEAIGEEPASNLSFGQAKEVAGKEIKSMGMRVEVYNGSNWVGFVTTGDEAYGPKFPAARWTSDMKYGIRFFSFPQGTYRVTSYVTYDDGDVFGTPVEFTVE